MFCLRVPTDPAWAREAVKDLDEVLVDHAHCEMKAASNALSLIVRHPGDLALVQALTELAREELDHFKRAVAFLAKRGLSLGAPPVDEYAASLRQTMKGLPSNVPPLVDRLLVGALIEARSCERFKLLLEALPEGTPEDLRDFYQELFACEARHYRAYCDLAIQAADGDSALVLARLDQLAADEGKIVAALEARQARATVHG